MADSHIAPEKITHPLQLMAAWFVMLIALVGSLLTGAAKIEHPAWAAGFLVISAVVLAILVMLAVFIMLTRFRPHLQGSKEYADWLKDERRFRGEITKPVQIREISEQKIYKRRSRGSTLRLERSHSDRDIATYIVEISPLEGDQDVLAALRAKGFTAEIYEASTGTPEDHASIWVGSRVPGPVAVLAMKTVIDIWPHLRYIHVSSDGGSPPDYIHDQLYFGGSTETAQGYNLGVWTSEQIKNLPDDISTAGLHRLIRGKYN